MAKTWDYKDPDETLDYRIDWSDRLAGDTIATSVWVVPPGLTEGPNLNDETTTTIWLAGGVEGATHSLTNRITTAGGRTMDQSVLLAIKSK
ncbi:hypothetical protein HDIA_2005 [Hartmannibacter diazotrophicus]|uniref:Uncharacterized protein n=1 Tax=Hartmannibacter diazotrophicus TaxID=1482074 RepID=A0A2C9D5H7_9HYPH|nr:hypothetical protein [Hartmannibacter diazotrophicus]SON55546.1 hypothetical protein HDIA_2005 [Hartmannibacter diazotrophicus]